MYPMSFVAPRFSNLTKFTKLQAYKDAQSTEFNYSAYVAQKRGELGNTILATIALPEENITITALDVLTAMRQLGGDAGMMRIEDFRSIAFRKLAHPVPSEHRANINRAIRNFCDEQYFELQSGHFYNGITQLCKDLTDPLP